MAMRFIGVLLLFIAVSGCTSADNSQMLKIQLDEVTSRLRDLESANAGTRKRVKKLETDVLVLKDRVSAMKHTRFQRKPVVDETPDRNIPLERLSPSMETRTPKQKEDSIKITSVRDGLNMDYDSIDNEGVAHPYDTKNKTATVAEPKNPVEQTETTPKEKVGDIQTLYRTAFDAYRHGEPDKAISLFKKFLDYPKNDLSDNALYWMGECYYDKRLFSKAKGFFTNVVTEYPKGNKVADAMLKLGMCNEMLNRFKDAKRLFKAVMLGYPDSSAARIAMERIHALQ